MRRFISYIYHYADGTYKCGNVGFCKVEQDGPRRTVNLCVKDVKPLEGKCRVSILKEGGKGDGPGKAYTRYAMDKELAMHGGILNEKIQVEDGDGLMLQCGDRKYVVLWKSTEETICIVENIIKETKNQAERCQEQVDQRQIENIAHRFTESRRIEENSNKDIERKPVDRRDMSEYQRLYNRFGKNRMILEDREYQVVKLKPQDMMWFPRCHWRLINNSLVMDGYYRYGHILFLQYDEQFVLAVPGVDSEKTGMLAERCGFTKRIYGCEYGREDIRRPYWLKFL